MGAKPVTFVRAEMIEAVEYVAELEGTMPALSRA